MLTRLFVLVCLLASVSATSASIFLTATNYPSGDVPVAAAVRDLNNDGIADIASANGTNVSIFLGNGDGTFGPANTFSVGAGAIEIASSDLNDDGHADLVVTDGLKSAYVVLGNGDGTFGPATKIALHNDPRGIAIADLNADGMPDLAIAIFGPGNNSQGEAAILIGRGDGSFAPPVFYPLTHNGSRLVATDLNNDGKLDLAVAVQHFSTPKNGLAVLLGNGDGTFQPVVTSIAGDMSDVAAGDFNGDGKIDLALAGYFSGTVQVVLGNGDGTFQPATTYSTDGIAMTVSAAALSGDGVLDLLVGGDHAAVFFGDGAGGFGPAALYSIGNRFARIGYFNDDQKPDIVAGGGSSEIEVALGGAHGAFKAPLAYPVSVEGFDVADFDGDGKADVVASDTQLSFLHGLGDGTFAEAVPFDDLTGQWLIAADFNGDGNPDVLLVPGIFRDAHIYTVLGNGDGTFQPPRATSVSIDDLWPTVGDFNRDGHIDVALAAPDNNKLIILLGNGDGSFQGEITYQTDRAPESPLAADFNNDGNPDLAVCNAGGQTVGIYLGNGDGTFASPLDVSIFGPVFSGAGDFNRDGKMDLVIGGGSTSVFLGNGDGTFQPPQTILSDYGEIEVADIDRDGRPDIMVSEEFSGLLAVIRGGGDGTFRPGVEFPPGSLNPGFFALRDLNGDKTPEAIVNTQNGSLTVLLNTSRPR